jgi:hypothetical protein
MNTKTTPPTWADLAELEPRLQPMLNEIQSIKDDGQSRRFCADEIWVSEFKPELCRIIGFGRRPAHPILSTAFAYEIAFDKLRDAFPPCRNCACL